MKTDNSHQEDRVLILVNSPLHPGAIIAGDNSTQYFWSPAADDREYVRIYRYEYFSDFFDGGRGPSYNTDFEAIKLPLTPRGSNNLDLCRELALKEINNLLDSEGKTTVDLIRDMEAKVVLERHKANLLEIEAKKAHNRVDALELDLDALITRLEIGSLPQ